MGELTRNYDWSKTSLGTPDGWPQSLRNYLSLLLNSSFPMLLFWGPEQTCFYNDAVRPSLGNEGKHPAILGMPAKEAWAEMWDFFGPLLDGILAGGDAVWYEDQLVPFNRNGRIEDSYWTFSYSPVCDDAGNVAGMFTACTETTKAVESVKQLKESEARFQNLLRDATVGLVVLIGEELRVEEVNEAWCRLVGHTVEETLHRPLFEVVPDAEAYFRPNLEKVLATGIPFSMNDAPYQVHGADGAEINGFVSFVYQPYREADGTITGVMAVVHDVTEQISVRKKLEESENKLRSIVSTAPAAIGLFVGRDLIIENPNQTFIDIVGKGWGVEGLPLREAMPELITEGQPFLKILDDVYTTGVPFHSPGSLVKIVQNGVLTHRYYNITYTPVRNDAGEVYAILDVAIDVTEQIEARQKVEDAEAALRAAIDLAELATWHIDMQTRQITYSPRLQEWLGIDGRTLSFEESPLVHERDRERISLAVQKALAPGGTGVIDEVYTITHIKTGQQRIVHSSGKARFDEAGKPVSMSGISQDITMQREMQTALEAEVLQRTEQLAAAIEDLKESNTQLQHSNDELAQYAYVASHDLQEPLRKIRVFTGMLKGGQNVPESTQPTIDKINGSAARMSELIQDLLEFSRLLKSDTLMRPVALGDVVQAVWSDFELLVEERGASIELGKLPEIQAVNLQINQLFYNLISNALKFTAPEVAPRIAIASRPISGAELERFISRPFPFSNYHHITVSDNGIGFETQYNEQIFEVFKRLHGRDMYPGSGIGLALCRRIAANHHGALYAESQMGKGSTFHIILPEKQHETVSDFSADYAAFPAAN